MIRNIIVLVCVFLIKFLSSQNFEIKTDSIQYKGAKSYYVVVSKEGESKLSKPLFFFCQGSLARPLIRSKEGYDYFMLPFDLNIIIQNYHLIMVNKPGLPLSEDVNNLSSNLTFPKEGLPPKEYILNNNLNFYYKRNNKIIKEIIKEDWVDKSKIVVAGHSEGSYIALEMASHNPKITHMIYSGGNPLGRMMSIVNQNRMDRDEKETWVENSLKFWKKVVSAKDEFELNQENTSFYTYGLSHNFMPKLLKLKIPILVTYGTKGQNAIFNDYLHVESIRKGKNNFTFKTYFNCDHNFFPIDKNGDPNYDILNWDKVVKYWVDWSNY